MQKIIKDIIYAIFAAFILGFIIGTFFPNGITQQKNNHKFMAWARSLGFGPPKFEYNNNKEYITSLKKCIDYINFDLYPSEQINTELIIAQSIVESDYGNSRFAREKVIIYLELEFGVKMEYFLIINQNQLIGV